MVEEAATDTPI